MECTLTLTHHLTTRAGLAAGGATLPGYLPQQTTIRPRSPGGGSASDLTGGRQIHYGDGSGTGASAQGANWMQQQQQQQQQQMVSRLCRQQRLQCCCSLGSSEAHMVRAIPAAVMRIPGRARAEVLSQQPGLSFLCGKF